MSEEIQGQWMHLSPMSKLMIVLVGFERYCQYHHIRGKEIDEFIDYTWRGLTDEFYPWERGFGDLAIFSSPGRVIPEALEEDIPAGLREEFKALFDNTMETGQSMWYGSNVDGHERAFSIVRAILDKYEIPLPSP